MEFHHPNELRTFLEDRGVDVDAWGSGNAKGLDHLYAEVQSGESKLLYDNDVLIRYFRGVIVHTYFGAYKLHEDRQEFHDGRVRKRGFDFLAEKLTPRENPFFAAKRCLKEEIGVSGTIPWYLRNEVLPHADSMSYPGILTIGDLTHYEVELAPFQYKKSGYVEEQESKTNYYVWQYDKLRVTKTFDPNPILEDDRGKNATFESLETAYVDSSTSDN